MPHLERASIDDAQAIAATLVASIGELCAPDHHSDRDVIARWTANKTEANAARWIGDPRVVVVVSREGGSVACVGAVAGDEVTLNYVHPDHRFQGHSKAVLAHLEATLRERGVTEARLTSTMTALRFYRDAAWRDDGALQTMFGLSGQPMRKVL